MIHQLAERSISIFKPQSVATNATVTGNVDRLGYDYVSIDLHLDSQASTTTIPTAITIAEADNTSATSFVTIAPLCGGSAANTSGNFVLPNAQTVANIIQINIDCRARKRYLQLGFTAAVGAQIASATARLGRAKEPPTAAAGAGTAGGSAMPYGATVVSA